MLGLHAYRYVFVVVGFCSSPFPTSEAKAGMGSKPPGWCFEHSRSQIMCRTGVPGPGQNHAIKYGGKSGRTKAQAESEAEAWLKKERVRQGRA